MTNNYKVVVFIKGSDYLLLDDIHKFVTASRGEGSIQMITNLRRCGPANDYEGHNHIFCRFYPKISFENDPSKCFPEKNQDHSVCNL